MSKRNKRQNTKNTYQIPAAVKSTAAVQEPTPHPEAPRREGFDIDRWRLAIRSAEDPMYPDRTLLLDIYNDILLDLHLTAVIDKRIEAVKGTELIFSEGSKPNSAVNALIKSPWFTEMLGDILESRFWGPTTMWLDLSGGVFHKYRKYDRRYIIPEKGLFIERPGRLSGIDITAGRYPDYIIMAGNPDEFGLLIKAVPWVLLKRGDISDWATFNEIFAAPIRKGKYPQYNPEAKAALAKAISKSGGFSWYMLPEGTDIEFVQNTSGGSSTNAYIEFAKFCNKELSKGFIHGTMTLDAEGGQYKGDIHEGSEAAVHKSDFRYVTDFLNTVFRRLLQVHGFNPGDGKFSFIVEEHICLKDRLDMDTRLAEKIEFPVGYWYEKYNVPLPEGGAKAAAPFRTQIQNMLREALDERLPVQPLPKREKKLRDFFG